MNLPTVKPQYDPITEKEARVIGGAASRLAQLRDLLRSTARGASLTVQTSNGAQSLFLGSLDAEACLALLIEREGQFLTSYGVILEETPK